MTGLEVTFIVSAIFIASVREGTDGVGIGILIGGLLYSWLW